MNQAANRSSRSYGFRRPADKDGHFRAALAERGCGLSGVEDLVGVLGKPAHMMLIGQYSKNLSRIAVARRVEAVIRSSGKEALCDRLPCLRS